MSKKLLVMLTAMGTLSVTLVAAPIIQNVTAKIDPAISFELNGEKVMKDSKALMYNDTLYVPVRALGETLDADISYANKVVSIQTDQEEQTSANTKNSQPISTEVSNVEVTNVELNEAVILNVDTETNQVEVLPAGQEDLPANYISLRVTENTTITKDDATITLDQLQPGMTISARHGEASTRSLPPTAEAFTLRVLKDAEVATPENVTLKNVEILEVNETEAGYSLLIAQENGTETQQIILHISEDTSIKHEKDKRIYKASDLTKGMKLNVVHGPAMTLSLPGQATAIEIVILAQ